jgi:hypothetical protein
MRRARSDVAEKVFDLGPRKNASAISRQKGAEGATRDFFSNVKKCVRYA